MNSRKHAVLALVLSSLTVWALQAQVPRTVYIDASSNNGPAEWNNLPFNTLGATALLKDSLTNATGIRATVTVRLNGVNTSGATSLTGAATEFAPAGGNSSYGHTNVWSGVPPILLGEVVFSNLNPTVAHSFTFFASRTGVSDVRQARYSVFGTNSGFADLDAANNSSQVATVADIYPDAQGVIVVRIQQGPNNNNPPNGFFYITAMKIAYEEPPPTVIYVDAAGTSAAAGWNLLGFNETSDVVLLATNGVNTGIRAQVAVPLGSVNTTGGPRLIGDAAEFQPAGTGVAFGGSATASLMNLYFPKPGVPHTLTFFASRVGSGASDTRQAFYTVTGATAVSNHLEAANNTQNVAVVANVYPAADGTLSVRIQRGLTNSTGYIYLSAFKISYVDNGIPLPEPEALLGKRLLFFGNQYTSTENVPNLVAGLAELGGHARPFFVSETANNRTLADQIARVNSYPGFNVNPVTLTGTNTWDYVVMQGHGDESSSLGNVTAFRTNALALYRKVRDHASGKGAGAKAVLFQTWARGAGAAVYPATFSDPAAMQGEIRGNYAIASNNIAVAEGEGSVRLAAAGDAFACGGFDTSRLYAANLSDPANAGPELAALALYKTLYGVTSVTGLSYEAAVAAGVTTMNESDWTRVTHWADGLTPTEPQPPAPGDTRVLLLDACSNGAGTPIYTGWNYKSFNTTGVVANLVFSNGYPSAISCEVLQRMNGTAPSEANPTGAAAVFAKALANNAWGNIYEHTGSPYSNEYCVARFSGLSPIAAYTFTCYASRASTTGRETRFIVEGANSGTADLEAGNNSSQVAVIAKIRPRPDGTIDLKITAGPNNTSTPKYYHITALKIESGRAGTLLDLR